MYKIQIQLNMMEKIMDERAVDNVNSVYFNDNSNSEIR